MVKRNIDKIANYYNDNDDHMDSEFDDNKTNRPSRNLSKKGEDEENKA